jgi:hypothetical protein
MPASIQGQTNVDQSPKINTLPIVLIPETLSHLSISDLALASMTCRSWNSAGKKVFWEKTFVNCHAKKDLLKAALRLEKLFNSSAADNKLAIEDFMKTYAYRDVSIQVNGCKNIFQTLYYDDKKTVLTKLMTKLFNHRTSSIPFKMETLDFMTGMNLSSSLLSKLKWTKNKITNGNIPKVINPFSLVEVPANLARKIKIHPDHEFANGELVAVIDRGGSINGFSTLYFGIIYNTFESKHRVYLAKDNHNECSHICIKNKYEIGKFPENMPLPLKLSAN